MAEARTQSPALKPVDSLVVDVITDDVSDAYVSKTLFAVSEFTNVVLAGAKVISGETLLCANLGLGLRRCPRPAASGTPCCSTRVRKAPFSCATVPISGSGWGRWRASP